MPETLKAREVLLKYKNDNDITYEQLSLMCGYKKQEIQRALTGERKGATENTIILKLIQMFGLA